MRSGQIYYGIHRKVDTENIPPSGVVLGYDERTKKWVEVEYRHSSNVFFDHPYTGALYPKFRMSKWKEKAN